MAVVGKMVKRCCAECGAAYEARRAESEFCSTSCRMAFNNRRAARGVQLYDLFMAQRYERADSKDWGTWSAMCRLAEDFRGEDIEKRAGRKSWGDWKAFMSNRPWLKAARMANIAFKRRA